MITNSPGSISHLAWATGHAEGVRAKASPTKDDRLFLLLFDKPDRTPTESRTLSALVRVERAKETVRAGRSTIRQVTSAKAREERRARDHERFKASGLMTMVGLLDNKTGKPTWEIATLLGALDAMARATITDEQRARWTARGDELLQERANTKTPLQTA